MKTVADRHRHIIIITNTSDELFNGVNIDDLECPLTPKIWGFSVLKLMHISRVNCTDMARDRPGQPVNRKC